MEILPVIHHLSNELTVKNAELAFKYGCDGVFVISHTGDDEEVVDVANLLKRLFPDKFIGINLLRTSFQMAVRNALNFNLDAVWTDFPGVSGEGIDVTTASMDRGNVQCFASVAFKYQPHEPNPGKACTNVKSLNMIPTTSGPGTGEPPSRDKIQLMRNALGVGYPLAIASGITPENIHEFKDLATHILIATGISSDFHTFSEEKLKALMEKV
jgi:predicted TIM-barrel enzyme